MKLKSALLGVATLLAGVSTAAAVDRTETIRFERGATFKTLAGTIRGYDGVKYQLGAAAGQVMSVLFKPRNNACYMNVVAPGSQAAIHIGSTAGNEYAGNLQASGNYTIQVYLMRSAARRNETCKYSMTVEITGPARAAAPAGGDVVVPGTNFSATGSIPCARAAGQPMANCRFGVARSGARVGPGNRVLAGRRQPDHFVRERDTCVVRPIASRRRCSPVVQSQRRSFPDHDRSAALRNSRRGRQRRLVGEARLSCSCFPALRARRVGPGVDHDAPLVADRQTSCCPRLVHPPICNLVTPVATISSARRDRARMTETPGPAQPEADRSIRIHDQSSRRHCRKDRGLHPRRGDPL